MEPRQRRSERRTDQTRRRISNLILIAGALAMLAPLAPWLYDILYQKYLISQFDSSPVIVAPPPGESVPPPPVTEQSPVLPAPEQPEPIVVDQSAGPAAYLLDLPTIDVKYAVMADIDDAHLARGPGHYPKTPLPGEAGNAAIAGHRTVKGRPSYFFGLNNIKEGDPIRVAYQTEMLTFEVERVFLTSPYDLSVLAPTPYPTLTLTTCDPPGRDDRRLIVRAKLVKVEPTATAL